MTSLSTNQDGLDISRKRRKWRPRLQATCRNCGKIFFVLQSRLDIGKGKFCSTRCGKKGIFNSQWKGGSRKSGGYIYLKNESHPFATKKGYVKRSHLIIERYIGRYIKRGEIVHHKNGNREDDRIENLELLPSQSKHLRTHMLGNTIWSGRKHKSETIEKMKRSWTEERKISFKKKYSGKNNSNYRHGRYSL